MDECQKPQKLGIEIAGSLGSSGSLWFLASL